MMMMIWDEMKKAASGIEEKFFTVGLHSILLFYFFRIFLTC
jgi:hypothetical protein